MNGPEAMNERHDKDWVVLAVKHGYVHAAVHDTDFVGIRLLHIGRDVFSQVEKQYKGQGLYRLSVSCEENGMTCWAMKPLADVTRWA